MQKFSQFIYLNKNQITSCLINDTICTLTKFIHFLVFFGFVFTHCKYENLEYIINFLNQLYKKMNSYKSDFMKNYKFIIIEKFIYYKKILIINKR